ncbi:MAG TPA: TlpA disulfide reductase family protein [Acidimicrobiales bacterium]|nr:TlpA disulfide reductase family protein [Acidimicrobiales bacterium]
MSKATTRSRPAGRGRPPSRGARSRKVLPAAAGLVGAMAVVAVIIGLAVGSTDKVSVASQTGEVRVAGAALTPFAAGQQDPSVGRPAPELRGSTFDGEAITIGGGGRPQIVVFVAHWCSHCQAEVPRIVDWLAAGRLHGAGFVAVSTGVDPSRPNYPPSAWLEREGWTIPTIADDTDGTAGAAYGLTGYPYFVAVKADGTVAARAGGQLTLEQLQALIGAAQE